MKAPVRRGLFILLERLERKIKYNKEGVRVGNTEERGICRAWQVNRDFTPRRFGSYYGRKIARLQSMAGGIGSSHVGR